MEDDTEKQILRELGNISQSLEQINEKLDYIDESEDTSMTWDILKILLLVMILGGPAIGFIMIIWKAIKNMFFG